MTAARHARPEAVYRYCNVGAQVLFEVVRFPEKEFRIRRPGSRAGTSVWNLDGVERVPYRLEEVSLVDDVVIVEGEKDVESLRRFGIVASTNPGGAGGWRPEFAKYFRGKRVTVVPDQDGPGQAWADRVLGDLYGVASDVKRINLPGLKPGSGADVTDWLNAGRTKRELLAVVEAAPRWSPPWEASDALLCGIEGFLTRFLVVPRSTALPLAAWTIATHAFKVFDAFPYLAVLSPTKRCGKTRLTEVLALVTARAVRAVNISEAALFRLIEDKSPTLILDETEALTGKSERAEAIRALLNAGNRRDAVVPRCVGSSHDLAMFGVFCPKVLVAIGNLPDTVRDRSIVVSMQRRKPDEHVSRFLYRKVMPEAEALRNQISSFVNKHKSEIERAYQNVELEFLEDRDAESWEPLFAVVAVADRSRVDELQRCAEQLTANKASADVDDSLALRLLSDLRTVWPDGQQAALTAELLPLLKGIEDSPWSADERRELTPRRLAHMLGPFEVEPRQVRVGERTAKGYLRQELEGAFSRYLGSKAKLRNKPHKYWRLVTFSRGNSHPLFPLGKTLRTCINTALFPLFPLDGE